MYDFWIGNINIAPILSFFYLAIMLGACGVAWGCWAFFD